MTRDLAQEINQHLRAAKAELILAKSLIPKDDITEAEGLVMLILQKLSHAISGMEHTIRRLS